MPRAPSIHSLQVLCKITTETRRLLTFKGKSGSKKIPNKTFIKPVAVCYYVISVIALLPSFPLDYTSAQLFGL